MKSSSATFLLLYPLFHLKHGKKVLRFLQTDWPILRFPYLACPHIYSSSASSTHAFIAKASAQMAQDTCGNAEFINLSADQANPMRNTATLSGTTIGSTTDFVGLCGANTNASPGGVWYKIRANGHPLSFSTCNDPSTTDTKISVFKGACGAIAANCVRGNDDAPCGYLGKKSYVAIETTNDQVYRVLVHGAKGDFILTVTETIPAVASDSCAGADFITLNPLTLSASVSGTTASAGFDGAGFCGTGNTGPGVWYKIRANGKFLTFSTCESGSSFDTKISVFTGCGASQVCVGGNDDAANCGNAGQQSLFGIQTQADVVYRILVHGVSTTVGAFTLTVTETAAPPPAPNACNYAHGSPGCCSSHCQNLVQLHHSEACATSWTTDCENAACGTGPSDNLGPLCDREACRGMCESYCPNAIETGNTSPSDFPSAKPSKSQSPSAWPSARPSQNPSAAPSKKPTSQPSALPSQSPSGEPSTKPSQYPSTLPSKEPSAIPSSLPSMQPSGLPSSKPSSIPSSLPSVKPSRFPSSQPSIADCVQSTNTCDYSVSTLGDEPMEASSSVCVRKGNDEPKSKCVANELLVNRYPGDRLLDKKGEESDHVILNCGCCTQDSTDTDYCGLGCIPEFASDICGVGKSGAAKVPMCVVGKGDKLETKCREPFDVDFGKGDTCGNCPP